MKGTFITPITSGLSVDFDMPTEVFIGETFSVTASTAYEVTSFYNPANVKSQNWYYTHTTDLYPIFPYQNWKYWERFGFKNLNTSTFSTIPNYPIWLGELGTQSIWMLQSNGTDIGIKKKDILVKERVGQEYLYIIRACNPDPLSTTTTLCIQEFETAVPLKILKSSISLTAPASNNWDYANGSFYLPGGRFDDDFNKLISQSIGSKIVNDGGTPSNIYTISGATVRKFDQDLATISTATHQNATTYTLDYDRVNNRLFVGGAYTSGTGSVSVYDTNLIEIARLPITTNSFKVKVNQTNGNIYVGQTRVTGASIRAYNSSFTQLWQFDTRSQRNVIDIDYDSSGDVYVLSVSSPTSINTSNCNVHKISSTGSQIWAYDPAQDPSSFTSLILDKNGNINIFRGSPSGGPDNPAGGAFGSHIVLNGSTGAVITGQSVTDSRFYFMPNANTTAIGSPMFMTKLV